MSPPAGAEWTFQAFNAEPLKKKNQGKVNLALIKDKATIKLGTTKYEDKKIRDAVEYVNKRYTRFTGANQNCSRYVYDILYIAGYLPEESVGPGRIYTPNNVALDIQMTIESRKNK
ncbi:MAG: hypothetical protein SFY92_11185 [Verrucomicrobiae bacterium]|nr:hypothetical protein [Verrucomicrobiae bacterium]